MIEIFSKCFLIKHSLPVNATSTGLNFFFWITMSVQPARPIRIKPGSSSDLSHGAWWFDRETPSDPKKFVLRGNRTWDRAPTHTSQPSPLPTALTPWGSLDFNYKEYIMKHAICLSIIYQT